MANFSRDRLTFATYAMVSLWGWFVMAIGPTVPLLTREFGISKGVGGLHGTALAMGAVGVGLISSRLVRNYGRRLIMLAGSVLMIVGTALLVAVPHVSVTLSAVLVVGIGGNLIMNVAQPALSVHHDVHGPAAVTEANASSALVGVFGPLAVGGAVALGWGWRPALLVTVILGILVFIFFYPLPASGALDGRVERSEPEQPRRRPWSRTRASYAPSLWFFTVGATAGVAIEFSTSFWAADLIISRTDAGPGIATAALAALFGGMGVVRVIGGRLSLRYAPEKLTLVAFVIAGIGWFFLWTAQEALIAVAALFLTGIGFGLLYPLTVALVLRASEGRPDAAQAIVSVTTGTAVALAPFILGAFADRVGSHKAFILIPVIIAIGAVAVALGLRDVHRRIRSAGLQPASVPEPDATATEP